MEDEDKTSIRVQSGSGPFRTHGRERGGTWDLRVTRVSRDDFRGSESLLGTFPSTRDGKPTDGTEWGRSRLPVHLTGMNQGTYNGQQRTSLKPLQTGRVEPWFRLGPTRTVPETFVNHICSFVTGMTPDGLRGLYP